MSITKTAEYYLENQSPAEAFTLTDAPVPIGAASASRRVCVFLSGIMTTGRTLDSATIGGVSCDYINATYGADEGGTNKFAALISAIVPTGTEALIQANYSNLVYFGQSAFVFVIDNNVYDFGGIVKTLEEEVTDVDTTSVDFTSITDAAIFSVITFSNGSGKSQDATGYSTTDEFNGTGGVVWKIGTTDGAESTVWTWDSGVSTTSIAANYVIPLIAGGLIAQMGGTNRGINNGINRRVN